MLKSEYRNEALQAIDTLMPMITVQKSDFENFRLLCCLSKGERHITTHILGVLTDTVIVGRSLVSISEGIRLFCQHCSLWFPKSLDPINQTLYTNYRYSIVQYLFVK